jgi:hypothetical protein
VSHPTINKNGDDSLKDPIHERFHVVLEEVVDEQAHYWFLVVRDTLARIRSHASVAVAGDGEDEEKLTRDADHTSAR